MAATDLDEKFMPPELIWPLTPGCGWFEDIEYQSTLRLAFVVFQRKLFPWSGC